MSALILVITIISAIYSRSLNREYQKKIHQLSSGIIHEKKRFLKNAVERTIGMIECELKAGQKEAGPGDMSRKQVVQMTMKRVTRQIKHIRLIDNAYIWVNRIINDDGGDNYAVREIHPNLPQTEGDWLSTEIRDVKGNKPYKIELAGVKEKGEIYFGYYFKKMGSDEIAHKLSYAKLYKPWDWVIATGVYLDDVDQLVAAETKEMQATLNKQRRFSYFFAALAFTVSTLILIRFEKQISSLILSYEKDIQNYTSHLLKEKEKTEQALAEVRQLRRLLPICSNCKKIRDDQGYWNHLELFIETRSDASFSHGICPECSDKLYGSQDWYQRMKKKKDRAGEKNE